VLPSYIRLTRPVLSVQRVPWYKNTFPTYAGIFLWVGFYLELAGSTASEANISVCMAALLVSGLLCFGLYYYVPAMLGMQTGRPLYVIGTSTFGTKGGYLIPGLLMGFLQLGWVSAIASVATDLIMRGLHLRSRIAFSVIALLWIYSLAWVAIRGIQHVARVAKFLNWVPLVMIVIVFWVNRVGIGHYQTMRNDPGGGFLNMLTIVIGFFATAGAAGADFGMNNRNGRDIVLAGIFGIVAAILIAGGLPLLSVVGSIGRHAVNTYSYSGAIASVGTLAPAMFFLFAAASLVPACFSTFIASNSFSTMFPRIPRTISTLMGVTGSALLAISGLANNLVGFFSIVGASFGPICGAMCADYVLAGRRWSGPRDGINWAGYIAWSVSFLVAIAEHIPGLPRSWVNADRPAPVISFIVGFLLYFALSKARLQSPIVEEDCPRSAGALLA
jgi:cytosine permease